MPKQIKRLARINHLNKTEPLNIRVTPKLMDGIVNCANAAGVKYTEWVRGVLANAVMVQSGKNAEQIQEQKGKTQ